MAEVWSGGAAPGAADLITVRDTQTAIVTRIEGRTSMPERESLDSLARHHSSL